ncbi:MAG: HIT family protein [Acidimicrobiales bacterium]
MAECWICDENARQSSGPCDGAVAELETGFVRLHRRQRYRGQTFFASKACVREFYHLEPAVQARHLRELARVSAAVDAAFSPQKLNIESLGNGVPHLHWWITPRYADDPRPRSPIWENLDWLRDMWVDEPAMVPADGLEADARLLRAQLTLERSEQRANGYQ